MANQVTPVSTEQDVEAPPPPPPSDDQKTKAKDLFAAAIETSSKEKEQESTQASLPYPSNPPPDVVADEEEANRRWLSTQYLRRRRCVLCCGGCCGATVLVLGLVLLILSFTVLKVKDPTLTVNNMFVTKVLDPGLGTWENPLSLNATLTFDLSLRNPNVAAFAYEDSTTEFYYHDQMIGVAYAPDGKVGARRTTRMNATMDVLLDRIFQTNATLTVVEGDTLNLTSFTDIKGRVNVVGIYKRNIEVMLNCSMSLDLNTQTQSQALKNQHCLAHIR